MPSSDGAGGSDRRGCGGNGGSSSDDDDYELSGSPIELSSTPHSATHSPSPSLRLAEERSEKADVKSMQMAAGIGDDNNIETEVNLIGRHHWELPQEGLAVQTAMRLPPSGQKQRVPLASDMVKSQSHRVISAGSEMRYLQATSNRMILSQEGMEEMC